MGKMDDYLSFVKEQVTVQRNLAQKYEDSPYRKAQHLKSAKNFADLGQFLGEIRAKGTRDISYLNRGDSPRKRMSLTYEDIENAPDELLRELNLTDTDKQDLLVEYLIAEAGGILSLDKIMVELYRRTRDVPKRATITSRLFRMAQRGVIYNVPGKKGLYSTYEVTEDEAKRMFGPDGDGDDATPAATSTAPSTQTNASSAPSTTPLQDRMRAKLLASAAAPKRM